MRMLCVECIDSHRRDKSTEQQSTKRSADGEEWRWDHDSRFCETDNAATKGLLQRM